MRVFTVWFFPRFEGGNGGVLSMRMQVILDSSFARPGSASIWGGKKGEFRDWTKLGNDSTLGIILDSAVCHLTAPPWPRFFWVD